ncbi:MAG: GNAT family N-acetyltransferase [Sphingomonadales bacterium]|nr:GNAT family N-acetyltransferase [Sphingomonadales bacterium]
MRLVAGDLSLRRGGIDDLDAVLALQQAAYAPNRLLLGREPLPLLADYQQIFRDYEVWLADVDGLAGVLILQPRPDDLLIWSIATDLARQRGGLGKVLLAAAEVRARELKRDTIRLYTGAVLQHLIDWYGRHGYRVERIEQLSDRAITHMIKPLEKA